MAGKSGFDGSIKIDSSIDSKGFNSGISSMLGALKPLAAAVAALFIVLIGVKAVKSVALLASEFQRLSIAAQAVGQLQGIAASETRKLVDALIASGIQTDIANRAFVNFAREGLDTGLLPALARGAQDLNVFSAAGESSSDVMDRLIWGVLNLNALMLRRAGAGIDILEAEKKHGEQIGKTVNQMSLKEKRAGVLIAVIEKLKAVEGLYVLSQKTLAGQMSSNIRIVNELKAAIGGPFQAAMFTVVKGFNSMAKALTRAMTSGGLLRNILVELGAVALVVGRLLANVFQFIAKLFGAEAQVETPAAGVDELTSSLGEAAAAQEELTKQSKIAKGALAGFDELNILAQAVGAGAGAEDIGDVGLGGMLGEIDASEFTNMIEAMEEITKRADEMWAAFLKNEIVIAFINLFAAAVDFLRVVLEKLEKPWTWFSENVLDPLGEWTGGAFVEILDSITWAIEELTRVLDENPASFLVFIAILATLFAVLVGLGLPIWLIIAGIIAIIVIIKNWGAITDWMVEKLKGAWETQKQIWSLVGYFIKEKVAKPIREAFFSAFTAIFNFIKNILNNIIDFMNRLIVSVVGGVNTIIRTVNTVGSILPGFAPIGMLAAPQIPRLARGAVIPPNAEFMAIMGDQTSGKNIEAPEGLLRQIIREEVGSMKADIEIKFTGTLAALVRELKPVIDRENVRIGSSLVRSGV